jgi:hypothetical protein
LKKAFFLKQNSEHYLKPAGWGWRGFMIDIPAQNVPIANS